MGFYFRKSKSIGPLKLNFSKSGIGVSTGVKGARVSFGPRGTYVNVGRNGIYYRKKLGRSRKNSGYRTKGHEDLNKIARMPMNYPDDSITDNIMLSEDMTYDSDIEKAIKGAHTRSLLGIILWLIVCIIMAPILKVWVIPFAFISRFLVIYIFSLRLNYDLDEETTEEWNRFVDSIYELKRNKKLWMISGSSYLSNTKANAGVSRNVHRNVATIYKRPKWRIADWIRADVAKIEIRGACTIIFLPDTIVFSKNGKDVTLSYDQVDFWCSSLSFVEYGKVERDVRIEGYTHQFVNKDGSADLRYKYNPQHPVCSYGKITIHSREGVNVELHTSNVSTVYDIRKVFDRYKDYWCSIDKKVSLSEDKDKGPVVLYDLDRNSELYKTLRKADDLAYDVGNAARDIFEEVLSCKIRILDAVLYNNEWLLLYEGSERLDFRIKDMQELYNEKCSTKARFAPVSETKFLAYFEIGGNTKWAAELPLTKQLSEAIKEAEDYIVTVDTYYPDKVHEDQPQVSDQDNIEETYEDLPKEVSDEPYDNLFDSEVNSPGDDSDSNENKMIDDLMDFFE